MTEDQAYRAMFNYLESVWKRYPNIELGALLGDLSRDIWSDGTPGDPAVLKEWEAAVKKAMNAI
jgi:hypothetical protein